MDHLRSFSNSNLAALILKVNDQHYYSITSNPDHRSVSIIDQTRLPFEFCIRQLLTVKDAAEAISLMQVRGAPLIGATAAYGICLALNQDPSDESLQYASETLLKTRPTAVNLAWALQRIQAGVSAQPPGQRSKAAWQIAETICQEDVRMNESIGNHGLKLIKQAAIHKSNEPINVLTHCNAGWLATVDWGTALAPIYKAHDAGLAIHVWVDETRPRNQGSRLTAWELEAHGIPYHVIVDNAGGHLMQSGQVDLCIVGTDRTTANGDVCNKIGTYLKALAAYDNSIPFYVALPSPTIDWTLADGSQVPIEHRDALEITHMEGKGANGRLQQILISANNCSTANPAFDVTPARLISGLITERGVCAANKSALKSLFPELAS